MTDKQKYKLVRSSITKTHIPKLFDELVKSSGDEVTWNQIQEDGTKIAEITINGDITDVYAPNGGGAGSEGHRYDSENDSLAEGVNEEHGALSVAAGIRSHAEGAGTRANGEYSHAEGSDTITHNVSEHAEGQFNMSHSNSGTYGDAMNTQHSIGIGQFDTQNSEEYRKNAVEVMQNGDVYVYGVGGYNGTNPDTATRLQDYFSGPISNVILVRDNGFYVVDSNLNIGFYVNNTGAHSANIVEYEKIN